MGEVKLYYFSTDGFSEEYCVAAHSREEAVKAVTAHILAEFHDDAICAESTLNRMSRCAITEHPIGKVIQTEIS